MAFHEMVFSEDDEEVEKEIIKESNDHFPLQKQVTIPLIRETESENEKTVPEETLVLQLEKQLTQSHAREQQLRIELEMTKKLLSRARRKLKEKDKKIYSLEQEKL